jgi:hypothetical protein
MKGYKRYRKTKDMMAKLIQLKMNKSEGIILQTDAAKAQEE